MKRLTSNHSKAILIVGALNALLAIGCRAEPPAQARVRAEVEQLFVSPQSMTTQALDVAATHVAVVRKNADGTLSRRCVDDADSAVRFLQRAQ
jgi:hypothetical protein